MDDILNSNSPEIKELFEIIESIHLNIISRVDTNKATLSGDYYLDNNEVCKILRLSSRTLQDYRNKGLIAFYKLEGKILYKLSDIQKMLDNHYFDAWKHG